MQTLERTIYVLLTPFQLLPFLFLFDYDLSVETFFPYVAVVLAANLAVGFIFRPMSDTSTLVFLVCGGLGTVISLGWMITLGSITLWPSLALLAIGLGSLVRDPEHFRAVDTTVVE